MNSELEISIKPQSEKYSTEDSRWQSQIDDLITDFQKQIGTVRKNITPEPGKKSGLEEILVSLGTSGAITAMIKIFKTWLDRDKTRNIKIKTVRDGKVEEFEINSTGIKTKFLEETLNKMLQSEKGG
jgi:hypothetical protein